MAEGEIDKLHLDIKVEDDNSAAKINAVAEAINNLQKSLSGLSKVQGQLKALESTLKATSRGIKAPKNTGVNLPNVPMADLPETKQGENNFNRIQTKGAEETKKQRKEIEKQINSIKTLNKEQAKSGDAAKKGASGWSKFTRAVGRIALYRAIRAALKEITKAAQEGLGNLRTENKELDTSLSKLSATGTTLKNTFAGLLAPIIQTIEPFITRIADTLANYMNRLNEAKAAMSGASTYTKILTSDTEEYKKALDRANGSLLAFDQFTTLANKNTYTGVTTEEVDMAKEEAGEVLYQWETVKTTVIAIGAAFATWKITNFLSDVKNLATVLGGVTTMTGIVGAVIGIYNAVQGIHDILNPSWWSESTSGMQRFADVARVVFGIIAAIAGVLAIIKSGTVAGGILAAIAVTAAIGSIVAGMGSQAEKMKSFATGGDFQTGDYFVANENGNTELVASTNSGGSVMNLEQWERVSYSSFYRALADYNAAKDNGGSAVNMNQLGRAVASNSGFISEMNRRNSGLRLI